MNDTFATLVRPFHQLANPQTLLELVGIGVAIALALLAGRAARTVLGRRAPPPLPWQGALLEALIALTPAIGVLPLLLIARATYASLGVPTAALNTAFDLAIAFLVVRIGAFLLGRLLGPLSWLRRWESRLTWLVWVVIALQQVGWYTDIETALDAIDLVPGKGHFSLWSLFKSLVVVTGFMLASGLIARAVERRVMKLEGVAASTRLGISKFSHFFLISLGALLGVNAAGLDLTALTLLTGAIGIGLGFGLQAIASNFVSGFVLLLDKSVKPGDVISFTGLTGTSTENFGWVQELRGRCVVVRDRDGVDTLVPNQNLITSTFINWSYSDRKVRLKLPVRISYRDDPEVALQLLLGAVEGNRRVLNEPAPVTRLIQFSDHGMDLELRFWIADPQNGVNNVRSDVNRRIWRLFRDHGITIPVTQHEVRLLGDGIDR
ncbi:MAG TPA: mechanosensitive ion channel domain-containing protein [Steroidobacteraceae bacterium]|nr:mechanosensitive ion channel domain-containing protein [Steroidobacteraceae bacterium]